MEKNLKQTTPKLTPILRNQFPKGKSYLASKFVTCARVLEGGKTSCTDARIVARARHDRCSAFKSGWISSLLKRTKNIKLLKDKDKEDAFQFVTLHYLVKEISLFAEDEWYRSTLKLWGWILFGIRSCTNNLTRPEHCRMLINCF